MLLDALANHGKRLGVQNLLEPPGRPDGKLEETIVFLYPTSMYTASSQISQRSEQSLGLTCLTKHFSVQRIPDGSV